jgi:hypothetical protein
MCLAWPQLVHGDFAGGFCFSGIWAERGRNHTRTTTEKSKGVAHRGGDRAEPAQGSPRGPSCVTLTFPQTSLWKSERFRTDLLFEGAF